MWRFYHHAVKESRARETGALISYTYCLKSNGLHLHGILPKWWNVFTEVTPPRPRPSPDDQNMIVNWFWLEVDVHKDQSGAFCCDAVASLFISWFNLVIWTNSDFCGYVPGIPPSTEQRQNSRNSVNTERLQSDHQSWSCLFCVTCYSYHDVQRWRP